MINITEETDPIMVFGRPILETNTLVSPNEKSWRSNPSGTNDININTLAWACLKLVNPRYISAGINKIKIIRIGKEFLFLMAFIDSHSHEITIMHPTKEI